MIICVAREIARLNPSKEDFSVKMLSSDTDVLMLPINSVVHSSRCYLIFELSSGSTSSRELDVGAIVHKLGEQKARGLLGAYVCTGCDEIGKFNSITKARAIAVSMECPLSIIADGLPQLGQDICEVREYASNAVKSLIFCMQRRRRCCSRV